MNIQDKEYEILDVLSEITIVNTSVCSKHKISSSSHGERKIYLPGSIEEKNRFFDNFEGDIEGFLWTKNLKEYLQSAKREYFNPTQEYRNKTEMRGEFKELNDGLKEKEPILPFKVKKSEVTHTGLYINQASGKRIDKNWNLLTDIALPNISRLSIIKLRNVDSEDVEYYFKLSYGSTEALENVEKNSEDEIVRKIEESKMSVTEKEAVIMARIGQGTYRKKLLDELHICPFTLVDDEHLLVASHIKPWRSSTNKEKKDPKNGFVFTPTYDKLFDKGYITFDDNKTLVVSKWISKYNCERLGLVDGIIIEQLPNIEGKRKVYLEYHRKFIFKKLEDL